MRVPSARSTTDACLYRFRLRQKKLGMGLQRPCRGQACGGMLGAMARIALNLRHKTSAWASWLPHWPTCMGAISRVGLVGSIQ
jgi:hypothetical protein